MTKQDLKIVFLGTPEFAAYALEKIHRGGYNIAGVVTMPDKPAGRGHRMLQSPVKRYAVDHDLYLMQPVSLKDPAFVDDLRRLDADLFVVIAFRMLPEIVWSMPRLGTFNLHASLLPRYRGAAPINRAVMNGETVTGVTTFFLKHEIDTGDIIAQETVEIGADDDAGTVHDRLMELGARLTIETIDNIIAGEIKRTPQDKIADVAPCEAPKIFKEDCRIDWTQPAESVRNHVRGLSPYPGAWTVIEPIGEIKVFKAHKGENSASAPGTARISDNEIAVTCGDGLELVITDMQAPGKRRMTTGEYLRGFKGR